MRAGYVPCSFLPFELLWARQELLGKAQADVVVPVQRCLLSLPFILLLSVLVLRITFHALEFFGGGGVP